jgi:hypothetical protein
MKYIPLFILFALVACQPTTTDQEPDAHSTAEAEERRAQSVAAVEALGLPVNADMPLPVTSESITERSSEDVANRAIAVMLTAIKGERDPDPTLAANIQRFGERAAFSEKEAAFIEDQAPELQTRVDFSWRFECLHILLWALGDVDELQGPGEAADLGVEVTLVLDAGITLGEGREVRSASELLDQTDFYTHLLWSGRALRTSGAEFPDGYSYSVVYERLRALRWLVGYHGQAWDEVTLETPG